MFPPQDEIGRTTGFPLRGRPYGQYDRFEMKQIAFEPRREIIRSKIKIKEFSHANGDAGTKLNPKKWPELGQSSGRRHE